MKPFHELLFDYDGEIFNNQATIEQFCHVGFSGLSLVQIMQLMLQPD